MKMKYRLTQPAFTLTYLLEGVSRVDYQPFRHPVSSLSLSRAGWAQTVNFILIGLLSLVFAVDGRIR